MNTNFSSSNGKTPSLRLRNDEYNRYINDFKEPLKMDEAEKIYPGEEELINKLCADYGLTDKAPAAPVAEKDRHNAKHTIILFVKGPYTLPPEALLSSDRGELPIRPYIIQDTFTSYRMHIVARELLKSDRLSAPFPLDEEYVYEALRDTAFTAALEKMEGEGKGVQSLQVTFDADGHFKTEELDSDL